MLEEKNGYLIYLSPERFDTKVAYEFKKEVSSKIEEGKIRFVVDFSNVNFINSSGMGILISVMKELKKVGGVLKLAGVQESIKKLFEMTRLNKIFEMYNTVEEAINS